MPLECESGVAIADELRAVEDEAETVEDKIDIGRGQIILRTEDGVLCRGDRAAV